MKPTTCKIGSPTIVFNASHASATKPILPKAWKNIEWGTNVESNKPDGKFGPARMIFGDCWFMAPLSAVTTDKDGQKQLAESITKTWNGYRVTFAGSPAWYEVFISQERLRKYLSMLGGDADTRLIELAADKYFEGKGNYKSLFIAFLMKQGLSESEAEKRFLMSCLLNNVKDPMNFNPMRDGGSMPSLGIFLLLGIPPKEIGNIFMERSQVMKFLKENVINDQDGISVTSSGKKLTMSNGKYSHQLHIGWDVIRTEITSNATVDPKESVFLNALMQYLENPYDKEHVAALMSAAQNLKLQHINPEFFVQTLDADKYYMKENHRDLLRSGAEDVLQGGTGYIGIPGKHAVTIYEINEAAQSFTYSDPNFPTMVHSGDLPMLLDEIRFNFTLLDVVEPTYTPQDKEP